jgi:hypothetical protein
MPAAWATVMAHPFCSRTEVFARKLAGAASVALLVACAQSSEPPVHGGSAGIGGAGGTSAGQGGAGGTSAGIGGGTSAGQGGAGGTSAGQGGAQAGSNDQGGASGAGSDQGGAGGEYLDASGKCRRSLEPGIFGCPSSYAEALAAPNACGVACAGPAGDQLLFMRDCTPAVRCAYDASGATLVGASFGDDVPVHCDESYSVVAGAFPAQPTLNGYDRDLDCVPPAERSVAPLFNELFGKNDPIAVGGACRSGHDQCRGSVRALVCANENGVVLGDGTCEHCASDDDCTREDPYASPSVSCGAAGTCIFGSVLVGACTDLGNECFTADAGYVCRDGICTTCTTNEECTLSGAGYNLCLQGTCMRSEQMP